MYCKHPSLCVCLHGTDCLLSLLPNAFRGSHREEEVSVRLTKTLSFTAGLQEVIRIDMLTDMVAICSFVFLFFSLFFFFFSFCSCKGFGVQRSFACCSSKRVF